MTKNKSPTDQSKFPSKDLFGKGKVRDKVGEDDKFTKSNQNNEMLAYLCVCVCVCVSDLQ